MIGLRYVELSLKMGPLRFKKSLEISKDILSHIVEGRVEKLFMIALTFYSRLQISCLMKKFLELILQFTEKILNQLCPHPIQVVIEDRSG